MDFLTIILAFGLGFFVATAISIAAHRALAIRDKHIEEQQIHDLNRFISGGLAIGSIDFERIVQLLAELSDRAKATFAYKYVQSIKDDQSLLLSLRKYTEQTILTPQEGKPANTVSPLTTIGSNGQLKGKLKI